MIIIKRSSANSRAGIGWGSLLIVHHSPRTGGKRTAMRERCLYMTAEIPARHVAVGEGADIRLWEMHGIMRAAFQRTERSQGVDSAFRMERNAWIYTK